MSDNYTTIAIKLDDLETARDRLEKLLDIKLGGHSSSAWHRYFSTIGLVFPTISVFTNRQPGEGGNPLTEVNYEAFPLLISIENANTTDELNSIIDDILSDPEFGAVLVRKQFLDENSNEIDEDGNPIEDNP